MKKGNRERERERGREGYECSAGDRWGLVMAAYLVLHKPANPGRAGHAIKKRERRE